jgi:hypothetical protein
MYTFTELQMPETYKHNIPLVLKWQHKDLPHYKLSTCCKLINTIRGTEIRMVLKGYTRGFNIAGVFVSLKQLKEKLQPIKHEPCPF